jgi:hypothetical protein
MICYALKENSLKIGKRENYTFAYSNKYAEKTARVEKE